MPDPTTREVEGMFCIANITYSDGRWERPFYTMDPERARGYLEWLTQGGWRGLHFERFVEGKWVDWPVTVEDEGLSQTVKIGEAPDA